jgi:plastocyanin
MTKLVLTIAAIALVATACGGTKTGSPATSSSSSPAAGLPVALSGAVTDTATKDVRAQGTTVSGLAIRQRNDGGRYSFDPTFVHATPGAKVTVTVTNAGSVPHTFTIDALGIDDTLQPGDSKTVTFTLPSSGATRFYCRFHSGFGMQGAFYFRQGDAVSGSTTRSSSGGYGY